MKQDTLTMGPQVKKFQDNFAAYTGTKYAFAASNCTTAMHVCSQVIGLRPGDEVIVTPNTFIATSLVVLKEGATPVYADIDPRTFNIDPVEVTLFIMQDRTLQTQAVLSFPTSSGYRTYSRSCGMRRKSTARLRR